jgi:glycerophosphoryl diester phosphodiesterase
MEIVGHRGAKGLAPENTVASLLAAIEQNAAAIEFDLRVTKDQVVVLHHDPAIEDRQGRLFVIAECTYGELLAHKTDLATFEAAAQTIDRRVPMLVEVKPGVPPQPVVKAVKQLLKQGWEPTDLYLGSRSYALLKALHKALPEVSLFVIDSWSGVRATWRARRVGARRLHMNYRWLWPGFIRGISRGGYELYAYTLDDPIKANRWAQTGLAGVITDHPERYKLIRN